MNANQPKVFDTALRAESLSIAFVAARFNSLIVEKLVEGGLAAIRKNGGILENQSVIWVPGAFEIPIMAKKLALSGRYNAIVTLGCVIKGETDHYDIVAKESCSGINKAALDSGVPITLGILTVNSLSQALERAGSKMGNTGFNATTAAIEMANLFKALEV